MPRDQAVVPYWVPRALRSWKKVRRRLTRQQGLNREGMKVEGHRGTQHLPPQSQRGSLTAVARCSVLRAKLEARDHLRSPRDCHKAGALFSEGGWAVVAPTLLLSLPSSLFCPLSSSLLSPPCCLLSTSSLTWPCPSYVSLCTSSVSHTGGRGGAWEGLLLCSVGYPHSSSSRAGAAEICQAQPSSSPEGFPRALEVLKGLPSPPARHLGAGFPSLSSQLSPE